MQADDLHRDLDALWAEIRDTAPGNPNVPSIPAAPAPEFPHQLDLYQAAAARHYRGPLRVLAPAGSGKTRTLTARIAALTRRGVPPDRILALAFNRKAAEEMEERLTALGIHGVQARTFHSLGYAIAQEAFGWRYGAGNEAALHELLQELLQDHLPLPEHPGEARRLRLQAADRLQDAKSSLLPFEALTLEQEEETLSLEDLFTQLLRVQQLRGLLTFSDMIYFALRALVDDAGLRTRLQQRFDFLLVDEFQDLNRAQMLLVRILALPQDNLFVVGDDDQLIYAWRGAELDHILHFDRYYPGASSVILATNYRSGRSIVRHGRWLIAHNKERVDKDIRPSAGAPPGRIDLSLHTDLPAQAAAAVEWMRAVRDGQGLDWSDFGLLYRANRDARPLEEALAAAGIPFTPSGDPNLEAGDPPPEVIPGRATLLTIHKAKGKEFRYVVYFNLSRRAGSALTEADERRVAYVGITRAKDGLLITADAARPSPFLLEAALNPDYSDFAEAFLQRRLAGRYRQQLLRNRDWRGLLTSFKVLPRAEDLRTAFRADLESGIEPLATELHFRRILGIEKRP